MKASDPRFLSGLPVLRLSSAKALCGREALFDPIRSAGNSTLEER